MSEEILKALMQLFAIIAKQDEGAETSEIEYVQTFLSQQLNQETVEEYMSLFYSKAGIERGAGAKQKRKQRLTSVVDSVRILGLCKKINKKLNQKQKAVVLVRLFELVNTDRKFSEQRMAIINTVAEVFNITKEEFKSIETFVIENDSIALNEAGILQVNEKPKISQESKHILAESLNGSLLILQIPSVDLYFLRYTGTQDLYLNGLGISNRRIYLFASGSTIKLPKGKPIYYSDVVSNFMQGTSSVKLSFNINNIQYRFPGGELGLRNINFSEQQGKLIGIMGASGAGKTTLLNVLAGMSKPSEGEVLINGIDLYGNSDQIEGVIGYIPQDDLLIEELTVFDNLYFNAKLCFNDKSDEEIKILVEKTLKNLGLYERKDLKVGSPLNKLISGGQRKRLNIALELIREPSILFVDEPTSGLSSRDSENVMDLLSELTLKGKLIFVVIHQPSSDIYKMFDRMIILDTGGYMIYHGNPVEALVYFKKIDNQINSDVGECPTCGNVTPEIIFNIVEAQVVDEFGKYTGQRKVSPIEWEDFFHNHIKVESCEIVEEPPPASLNIPTWLKQFKIYSIRDFLSKISNTQYITLNLIEAPLLGFILSFIIRYIADPNSSIYIFRENENIPPYIFMSIIVALFLGLTVSAEEIFRDRKILKREKFLNLSRSSYLSSKILILTTISAIQAFLFVIVGNTILSVEGMFFQYWIALFSIFVNANMIGLNISASFNSAVTIYILIPLLMIPQMALGGAMFSFDKLNRVVGSVGKVPIIAEFMTSRWAYEALMVHQHKENTFQKQFFEIERKMSVADYKTVHYIPTLEEKAERVYNYLQDEARYNKNLPFLRNQIGLIIDSLKLCEDYKQYNNEFKEFLNQNYSFINQFSDGVFDTVVIKNCKKFIKQIDSYISKYNQKIDTITNPWNEDFFYERFELLDITIDSCSLFIENRKEDYDFIKKAIPLLQNEIKKEHLRNKDLYLDNIDFVLLGKINVEIAGEVLDYLSDLGDYYSEAFASADRQNENLKNWLDKEHPNWYRNNQKAFHNEAVTDIVRKVLEKNKILEFEDDLIQNYDPIYQNPLPQNRFDFRTHFYSPQKPLLGKIFDTFWFNIVTIWLFTILLYITLYYEHLSKLLNLFSRLKMPNYKKYIKKKKPLKETQIEIIETE